VERCLACEADRSETWWGEAPERQGECSKIVLVVVLVLDTFFRRSRFPPGRFTVLSVRATPNRAPQIEDEYEDECLGLSPGRSYSLLFFNLTSEPGRNTLPTRAW